MLNAHCAPFYSALSLCAFPRPVVGLANGDCILLALFYANGLLRGAHNDGRIRRRFSSFLRQLVVDHMRPPR